MKLFSGLILALISPFVWSQSKIVIIIDDLGNQTQSARQVTELPGPVVCAILPHRPFTNRIANWAEQNNKEVLVHLPMQSLANTKLGPGGLELDMDEQQFTQTVRSDVESVPFNMGVNNHMGSLMTQHPGNMRWLMNTLSQIPDKIFVDSRTTEKTVAAQTAREFDIPTVSRDIFLDDEVNKQAIESQFNKLIAIAKKNGSAIAIGHPHPQTLLVLEEKLPGLKEQGVELVSLAELMQIEHVTNSVDFAVIGE